MAEEKIQSKKLTMANTKKEMIQAYNEILGRLKEKQEAELKPEKKMEEKRAREVVEAVRTLSTEAVVKSIGNLKVEIGAMLAQISDKLEKEVNKFETLQKAIEAKEKEFQEVHEIEREAVTLAALIETQHKKSEDFEAEIAERKEGLHREIESTRTRWEKEKAEHDTKIKERDLEEKRRQDREKEAFAYEFGREQKLAKDRFEDEKRKLEKELILNKEQMEKELLEREKAVLGREKEWEELQKKVNGFQKEIDTTVTQAVKEVTERLKAEAKNREELLKKEFDGERNVFSTRVSSLEKTVQQQTEQVLKLSEQLEMAYQKVQDIALKAVEGSSTIKSFTGLQKLIDDQTRKASQDK